MPGPIAYNDRMGATGKTLRRVGAGLVWLGLFPNLAAADATVHVKLRDAQGSPAEGTVTLVDAGGNKVASCTTQSGTCDMAHVKGGSYRAEVIPKVGDAPKPRKVMIPPDGEVSLIVSTGGGA